MLAHGAIARADTVAAPKCQAALIRGSERVVAARTKALQRCEAAVVAGVPGYASSPGGLCADDAGKTAAAIAKAEEKFKRLVDSRCGGSDMTCGSGADDTGLNALDFYGGPCPGFVRKGCTNDRDHCGGVAADCPENPSGTPGICGGRRCLGGSNAGAPCAGPGDCAGGSCGVPGQPTARNA